jgi:lysozyme
VIVPDIYEGNAEPNWLILRLRTKRIVHKATQGTRHVDSKFAARYAKAHKYGIGVLAYHFCEPDQHSPKAEANHFLSVIHDKKLVGVALDCESRRGVDPLKILGAKRLEKWCRDFNHVVHDTTGHWPLFYANSDYIRRMDLAKPIGGGLWLASYGPNDGKHHPVPAPRPWKKIKLHQYTSVGRLAGVHPIDLSEGLV